eukprot:gene16104-biopygen9766
MWCTGRWGSPERVRSDAVCGPPLQTTGLGKTCTLASSHAVRHLRTHSVHLRTYSIHIRTYPPLCTLRELTQRGSYELLLLGILGGTMLCPAPNKKARGEKCHANKWRGAADLRDPEENRALFYPRRAAGQPGVAP